MINNIIQAVLDYRFVNTAKVWQYDYGKILRIKGENLPGTAEVHFSLNETGGDAITKVGVTTDGVAEVQVPDELLENGNTTFTYNIYAFVYIENGTSGSTEYRIKIPVQARPKPSDHVTPDNTDTDPFGDAVKAVNNAAERAKTSERKAKASEDAAAESAQKIANSATKLNAATKEALKSIEDKKAESVSTIEKQKESSVQSVTEHTDSEIQRMTQRVDEVDTSLGESIAEAAAKKSALDETVSTSVETKKSLDASVENGKKSETDLNKSIADSSKAKTALDESATTANETKSALDETVRQANALDTSLGSKIAEGMQLNKDIAASGQKAVSDINSASTQALNDINTTGAEKLDAVNKAAESIVADREQITKNKTDIALLNEDLVDLKDKKITKFYASNQGETYLADSDNGLMQDMHIYGKSEQKKYNGYQVFDPNVYPKKFALQACEVINENGVFKFFGEVSEYAVKWIKTKTLPAGTYFANCKISDNTAPSFRIYFVRNGKEIYIENNESFTLDGTEKEFQYGIGHTLNGGATLTGQTLTPSIVRGDSAQPYEPYTGGKSSPSPDYPQEIKSAVNPIIKVRGKNLLRYPYVEGNERRNGIVFTDNKDGSISVSGTATGVSYYNFNKKVDGKRLTLASGTYKLVVKGRSKCNVVVNNGVTSVKNEGTLTITDGHNETYSYIMVQEGVTVDETIYPMIQFVSITDESYEPYKEQSIQLPITLNAIPVRSGGNVTIDRQQYISDYVDVERRVIVRYVGVADQDAFMVRELNGVIAMHNKNNMYNVSSEYGHCATTISGKYMYSWNSADYAYHFTQKRGQNIVIVLPKLVTTVEQGEAIRAKGFKFYYIYSTPIEEPLTEELSQALKRLQTYYSVTNISVVSDQLDGWAMFDYQLSMKNGWDYVKKRLGDTREYIYDMDARVTDAEVTALETKIDTAILTAMMEG